MKRVVPYFLSSSAYLAGIGLTITSAWLITMASFSPPLLTLEVAIVGVRFFGISRSVARYFERLTSHRAVFNRLSQLRVKLYEAITDKPLTLIRDLGSGTLVKRVIDDVERVEEYELRITLPHAAAIISVLVSVLLGAWILPASVLITLPMSLLLLFLIPMFVKSGCEVLAGNIEQLESEYSALVEQSAYGIAEAQFYGYLDNRIARTNDLEKALVAAEMNLHKLNRKFQFGLTAIFGFTLVALSELALRTSATQPPVRIAMLIFLPLVMFESVTMWYPNLFGAGKLLMARREISEISRTEIAEQTPVFTIDSPVTLVVAKDVQAKWSRGEHFMEPVSFSVARGTTLVIRGRSGSGKSTLAMALLGLLDYDGEILLNGKELRTLDSTHVAGAIQNSHIFNTSLRENLKIADPLAGDDDLVAVLGLVELDGLLAELDEGLNTVIGQFGRALSGGEAKRLGLARALLSSADVIVLDEPTEHLDHDLAARIEERVLAMDRIFIVITHSGWESARTTLQLLR